MTRIRRAMVETDDGLAICVFEVDPPLAAGEVEIEIDEPALSRTSTPRMDEVALAAMLERIGKP